MVAVTFQEGSHTEQPDTSLNGIRAELEDTRLAFHSLVDFVSKSGCNLKSPSSDWTMGEVLVHLTWALEHLPREVENARRGRGMFNLPKRISDIFSYWYIRWIAYRTDLNSIRMRYDRAMDASIWLLDVIPNEDWKLGADFYGEGFHTVEDLFHVPAKHLAEHASGMEHFPYKRG